MSGRHRRAARALENAAREKRNMERFTAAVMNLGAEFIDAKLSLPSSPVPLEFFEALPAVMPLPSVRFAAPASCTLCSASPVVCSVGSQAAYCSTHWQRLWLGT